MPNPGLLASHNPRTHGKAFLNLIESGDWRLANDPARPKIENDGVPSAYFISRLSISGEVQMTARRPFIGMFLNLPEGDRETSARRDAFLQELGPLPGLSVATRFGAAEFDMYEQRAQELHDLRVDGAGPDLYFATCWPSLRALTKVRSHSKALSTPIVVAGVADLSADPERNPDYASNVYAFISYGKNLCGEWPRLLRGVAPNVVRAAVLYDMHRERPGAKDVYDEIVAEAGKLVPRLNVTRGIDCGSETDILEKDLLAFVNEAETPAGLIVAVSVLTARKRQTVVDLMNRLKLPAVYPNRLYTMHDGNTKHGGLASVGTYLPELYRRAGSCANQIITQIEGKGRLPSPRIDIVQTGLSRDPKQTAVFETVINLSAAHAIGLTVPNETLAKASVIIR